MLTGQHVMWAELARFGWLSLTGVILLSAIAKLAVQSDRRLSATARRFAALTAISVALFLIAGFLTMKVDETRDIGRAMLIPQDIAASAKAIDCRMTQRNPDGSWDLKGDIDIAGFHLDAVKGLRPGEALQGNGVDDWQLLETKCRQFWR